ncbi:NUMOD1 domain-containing DNA-binding protein [Staphylococcus coagulans]|uniref:NUMOD1 domain-containing DNA-binding protein n=1 Tax=Staphylococcus coagulans TaxID=74706 RepID=UPI001FD99092|nr:NUMOD1 domain-containing DNA-binding protein [Staphylococcus coagulans]
MVDFDKRLLIFLDYFKKYQKFKNVSQMAKALGISRRMIYYYLSKLNDILALSQNPLIIKDQEGYYHINQAQCNIIENYFEIKRQHLITFLTGKNAYYLLRVRYCLMIKR